jgi:phage gpG-like protein
MIEGTFDMRDALAGLDAMDRQAEQKAAIMFKELAKPARADVRQHQRDRKGIASSWPNRAQSTVARARRKSSRKRRKGRRAGLLGGLPSTWKTSTNASELKLSHRVKWATIHDEGGTAGKGARIPKRQFMYWSPEFLEESVEAFAEFVMGAW